MNWLIKLLTDLSARKFYGHITISFEGGAIRLVKKEETLKPE